MRVVKPEARVGSADAPSSARTNVAPRASEPLNVLLVDDRPEQLLALEVALADLGQNLVRAGSGKEALRRLLDADFAVILLDVYMPVVDGFETAELIRECERSHDTPIIFLTGMEGAETQTFRGYSLGAVDYVLKPFVPKIIRAKVGVFIELARKTRLLKEQTDLLRKNHGELIRLTDMRARLLEDLEISTTLAGSLDLKATIERVVGLAVDRVSDWCRIDIVDDVGNTWEATSSRSTQVNSLDSVLSVPLVARGRTIGLMTLGSVQPEAPSGRPTPDLAEEFAHRAALAIDNALLYRAAQEAVRARDDFLCIASHELRTPLTPLKLHVEALHRAAARKPEMFDEQSLERLGKIQRQSVRLERLVDHLLNVSRISGGCLTLEPEPMDLVEVVREVIQQMKDEVGPSLPDLRLDAPAAARGAWDSSRVAQVVTNLLSNAVKYGGGRPVDISVVDDGDAVRFVVRDYGCGIPKDQQERIFGRFERAASAREEGGLGLGLWIVNQIVTAHGGVVRIDSAPNAGAAFSFDLPKGARRPVP